MSEGKPLNAPPMLAMPGRAASLGEGTAVRRLLPTRGRRLVGPWCFLDHYGPDPVQGEGMSIGPHPHIGLQTVSWLLEGSILHRDSLGSEQLIRPGQLNLMTSGRGIAHSEEMPDKRPERLHGVQLWVALPEAVRGCDPAFDHHANLPATGFEGIRATVLMGEWGGVSSPARAFSPIVGVELSAEVATETSLPLNPAFEHAIVLLDGAIAVAGQPLEKGVLYYLGIGRDTLRIAMGADAKAMLIGGAPFPEPILMWWNFVARTADEMTEARDDWQAGRAFGSMADPLPRIPPPSLDPSMLRLRK